MIREQGMNFETFGKIADEKQQPWESPLPAFIEHIHLKRFGKDRPADERPIEEIWKAKKKKGEDGRMRKQLKKETEESPQKANPAIKG
jgi:hypothetical protein